MIRDCAQPHGRSVWEALTSNNSNYVHNCILRDNRGGRALKCCMRLWWCVVLPPTSNAHVTHKGTPPFVESYFTLTGFYDHHIAPGSDSLVDVYHLYERVKGRDGAQKVQNLQYLATSNSK